TRSAAPDPTGRDRNASTQSQGGIVGADRHRASGIGGRCWGEGDRNLIGDRIAISVTSGGKGKRNGAIGDLRRGGRVDRVHVRRARVEGPVASGPDPSRRHGESTVQCSSWCIRATRLIGTGIG